MQHLIIGYGYCGYYLARHLLAHDQQVTAVSRHLPTEFALPKLKHLVQDITQPFVWDLPETIVYYLIPPSAQGSEDLFLQQFLQHSKVSAKKIIYFGSSAVYGNHHGSWVNEESPCPLTNERQQRRLHAEQQWLTYCAQQNIESVILRIAGIYGPNRLPIEAAKALTPLIARHEAPMTNHIYVEDLAAIAYSLSQVSSPFNQFNVSDGKPAPMGTLQELVATSLHLAKAPYESFEQAFNRASPMKQEFMQASKCLSIERLKTTLGSDLQLSTLSKTVSDILT